jgi:hypothetical protein
MERRLVLVPMLAIAVLIASLGISGAQENVTIPLVEENGETGIPVTVFDDYVEIDLVAPAGKQIRIPYTATNSGDEITAIIVEEGEETEVVIAVQDWPQNGPVIPMSQDWPQGGELRLPVIDWPSHTTLSIIVPQDWPQDSMEAVLQ